ncbi:hypothetical protein SLEP1_g46362 [Rubroshorea leprosula]|uniref:CNNM transmembrane domain-containing protein n=1 Tax=Rubroshorea leprosula TaxID=152421 RepID=A0AAV5LM09_9ROSI|nr:hypothetical protein SLEP1_g46362 [Rubroshorea leprosula]
MRIFTKLSAPLCLLFVFLCLKTAFSSSIHASSFSTTHLCSREEALALLQFKTSFSINYTASDLAPYYCHVIALNLSCSFLYGTFPSNSTLFFLRNLQSLNLSFNDFRLSKIPSEISQFTRLKHLDVSSSQFSGQVPTEIAHLPKLVSLNLSSCYIPSGLILETTTFRNLVHNLSEMRELVLGGVTMTSVNPRFFMNLSSSLTTLDLSDSVSEGNFPNGIFRFPNLKIFHLSVSFEGQNLTIDLPSSNWSSPLQDFCNLEGSIPASIGNLTQLTSLDLSITQFSGPIPASIGNLRQLTSLGLSSNHLSGQIPSSLANLTQLTSLDLSINQFSGPIPASIGNLRQLTSLELHSNILSGQIPSSLANLTQLPSLDLSYNQFSGPIPASIGNLRQLTSLDLHSNILSGQIPSSLANITQLTSLDLSNNQFSDPILASICNLRQLTTLDLNSNNLSEQIPPSLANLTQLTLLYLHNNQFSGMLPPWIFTLPFSITVVLFGLEDDAGFLYVHVVHINSWKNKIFLFLNVTKPLGNFGLIGDLMQICVRVVNIGATALVIDTATAIFGEAAVSAATGVMTVAILLLTEITPKSIAVHNPAEVARFVGGQYWSDCFSSYLEKLVLVQQLE